MASKNTMPENSISDNFYSTCMFYNDMGYDLFITSMYGKSGLKMNKRYSYPLQKENISCFQICHIENLESDPEYLSDIVDFLYRNIESQENENRI